MSAHLFSPDGLNPAPAAFLPLVLAEAGANAVREFLNFLAGTIGNANTQRAYGKALARFFRWVQERGLSLQMIEAAHVGAYLAWLSQQPAARGGTISVATVKQSLAAIRSLFDHLVMTQVMRQNPATSVRGPRQAVEGGKTPVLDAEEARQLLESIDTSDGLGLRDRALIGVMVYSFARVGAAVGLNVEDYHVQGKRWYLTLHEKRGRVNRMPVHHKLVDYLDAYIEATGIGGEHKRPLFRSARGKTRVLSSKRLSTKDAHAMVQRRARAAGIATRIGCHTFRATGITAYLSNGGTLEKAQQMAGHASAKTTKLYDRRQDLVTLDEVERILI